MYRDSRKNARISLLNAESVLRMTKERIIRIEYGEEEVPPEKVVLMEDLYQTGNRLMLWHCGNGCSVGKCLGYEYQEMNPLLAGVKILSSAEKIIKKRHDLLNILDDGEITPDEIPQINKLCSDYKNLMTAILALKMEIEKTTLAGVAR